MLTTGNITMMKTMESFISIAQLISLHIYVYREYDGYKVIRLIKKNNHVI